MAGSHLSTRDLKQFRSVWKEHTGSDIWQFYCPLCKVARRMPYRPRPLPRHYLQVGLTSVVFMLATWPVFGGKGLVSFIPLWVIFETAFRIRARAALSCRNCGFDPYLFLVDVNRAKQEVSEHWRRKFAEKGIEFPETPS